MSEKKPSKDLSKLDKIEIETPSKPQFSSLSKMKPSSKKQRLEKQSSSDEEDNSTLYE